jgi:type II secretory pathway pseudopilin PulG
VVNPRRGYTLVALMIGVTVMLVAIAAILPLASAEAQRGKEEELIFRGKQYAEGIRTFRRRYGRYPNSLKEMLEIRPRTIRKLWKDPITNSDDWGLITILTGAPLPPPPRGSGAVPTPSPAPTPTKSPFGSNAQAAPAGPISGVYSKSKKRGFRTYDGREVYNEWRFTEVSLGAGPSGPCKPGPGGGC